MESKDFKTRRKDFVTVDEMDSRQVNDEGLKSDNLSSPVASAAHPLKIRCSFKRWSSIGDHVEPETSFRSRRVCSSTFKVTVLPL